MVISAKREMISSTFDEAVEGRVVAQPALQPDWRYYA
jgi:hypothetical protein